MSAQEHNLSYVYLRVAQTGHAILYIHTKREDTLEVHLPPHLTRHVKRLVKRHQQCHTPAERRLNGYISAKDFNAGPLSPKNLYNPKAYIYKTRRLIHLAARAAGMTVRAEHIIVHENGKGYAINPDVDADVDEST